MATRRRQAHRQSSVNPGHRQTSVDNGVGTGGLVLPTYCNKYMQVSQGEGIHELFEL